MKSIRNIENYYSNINEDTKFEAFKAIPYIVHMLGRDFTDTKCFWTAAAVFFKIAGKIREELSPHKAQTLNESFKYFGYNCVPCCIKGFADKSFFKILPKPFAQKMALYMIISSSGELKAEILSYYLTKSNLQKDHLDNVLEIIRKNQFGFTQDIFSQVAAETTKDHLKKNIDNRKLLFLYKYSRQNKLLPRTQLLIMHKILFQN